MLKCLLNSQFSIFVILFQKKVAHLHKISVYSNFENSFKNCTYTMCFLVWRSWKSHGFFEKFEWKFQNLFNHARRYISFTSDQLCCVAFRNFTLGRLRFHRSFLPCDTVALMSSWCFPKDGPVLESVSFSTRWKKKTRKDYESLHGQISKHLVSYFSTFFFSNLFFS